jgi:hypothetical protein
VCNGLQFDKYRSSMEGLVCVFVVGEVGEIRYCGNATRRTVLRAER